MEAGNRCYDSRSPEEVNRRLIDHASSVLLPYTKRSRQNLLAEGIHSSRIFVTGNPIWEVIQHYRLSGWRKSDALARLGLKAGKFFLVTLHREENVDNPVRLQGFLRSLDQLTRDYSMPVVVSTHPRTKKQLDMRLDVENAYSVAVTKLLRFLDPFSFFDFLALQSTAFCTLSDSGTVQEESCILGVPSVTLRDTTERPETVECGASVLSGCDPERILALVKQVTSQPTNWNLPPEYLRTNVAETVVRILTSHHERQIR
jgi:UDP-N-acetylglucosamine 2-epimerase (non-hydrolysing)